MESKEKQIRQSGNVHIWIVDYKQKDVHSLSFYIKAMAFLET